MELTLDSHASIKASGPVTIELPSYMMLLPPEEMVEARNSDNRATLVLAAGRHPSGSIVFITGDGSIREIDVETQKRELIWLATTTPVTLDDYGNTLVIHMAVNLEIDSGWAVKHSTSLVALGSVDGNRIRYVDE